MFFSFLFFSLSLSAQTSTNALPPLAPPYGEMPPTFWAQHGTVVLVAGFLFLAALGALGWMILRPKPPVAVPPEVLAREILEKLRHQAESGKVLSEISQTLRRYIVAAFALPPAELTTAEFSAAIAVNEKIGLELAAEVSDFLRECDQRNFAPANPAPPLGAAARALEIISQLEQRRAKLVVQP
jgi:hypothetical protein